MKNKSTWILAAVVLAASVMTGCGRNEAVHEHEEKEAAHQEEGEHGEEVKLTAEGIAKSGVRVEAARKQALADVIHAPGRAAFNAEKIAHVGAPVSGRVAEIKVRVGDTVKAGDVLLTVQSPQLGEAQSAYLLKRLAAEAAGPTVDVARASYERAKTLHAETEGITLAELQKREADYKTAVNAQATARAEVAAAENHLHLLGMDQKAIEALIESGHIHPVYAVRAPIGGQIVEREITLGEFINPEREALAVIADVSTLWVLADVPETRLHEIQIGADTAVTVAGQAKPLAGKVVFVAPVIQPETRTASVRVEVASTQALRPGMFVQVALKASAGEERVLAIPEEATQLVEGQTVVFVPVEGEANTFAKRPIETGPAVGRMLPVLKGLVEGERLVIAGSFILKAEHGKGSAGHEH